MAGSPIPNTISGVPLGASVNPQATFILPSSLNTTGAIVTYAVQDAQGNVYMNGNANSIVVTPIGNGKTQTIATVSFTVPTTLPLTQQGTKYQIVWTMTPVGQNPIYYVETFQVYSATYNIIGVPDLVEVDYVGDPNSVNVNLSAVLTSLSTSPQNQANVTLFYNNTPAYMQQGLSPTSSTAAGNYYSTTVSALQQTYNISPALSPNPVLWTYTDANTQLSNTIDGYFYYITPSILQAAYELQNAVNRARNPGRLSELDINLNVLLAFLKLGADYFNAAGYVTYFNMLNPQGAIRAFWLAFSEVQILRSQYLLEAERAFNLSGQSANLDLDITQYYDTMASSKQSWIDSEIGNFKKNLQRRGINQGDGSMGGPDSSYTGSIGVAITPLSNYYSFYSRRYPRFRG